jgi:hypothetical protein
MKSQVNVQKREIALYYNIWMFAYFVNKVIQIKLSINWNDEKIIQNTIEILFSNQNV